MVDYETIDARAHAGVYAVAALNSRGGEFDLLRENAQECGEFLKGTALGLSQIIDSLFHL